MKTIKKIALIIFSILAVLFLGFLALIYIPSLTFEPIAYKPIAPDYWPTEGFRISTPEKQGMDSAKLLEMLNTYETLHAEDPGFNIDSITIIRHGYIVADLYFNPLFPENTKHIIHSCTKSIMSALIGIAIEQGHIKDVDVPVIDFFADKEIPNMDPRMAEITLRDLLSMETGWRSRDSFLYKHSGLFAAQRTDDWVKYTLSLPVDVKPGVRFDYSNLSSFLLSAIIQETTDMDTLAFARKNLFDPLGIKDVQWEFSPQGIAIGYARMWLKPHDMAKFGMLYLQKGRWNNRQLIPSEWVKESLTPHAYPKNYHDMLDENGKKDAEMSQRNWIATKFIRPFNDGYGYQWWLERDGTYTALGVGGQYIMVSPEENLIVVFTSQSKGMGVLKPAKLFHDNIRKAVVSDEEIPATPAAQKKLMAMAPPPALSLKTSEVPDLPNIAREISGKTYALQTNNWRYNNFRFHFKPGSDYASFSYTAKESDVVSYKIGLDGQYRFTKTEIGSFAAKGSWTSPDTFEISYQLIGYSNPGKWSLIFNQEVIKVVEEGVTGVYEYSGRQQ